MKAKEKDEKPKNVKAKDEKAKDVKKVKKNKPKESPGFKKAVKESKKVQKKRWDANYDWLIKKFPVKVQKVVKTIPLKEVPPFDENLFLYGETGSGKTIMGAAIVMSHLYKLQMAGWSLFDTSFMYMPYSDLFFKIKEAYANKDHSDMAIIKECRETNILFLDDIGVKNVTDWVIEILYIILDYRVMNEKKTILTSNLTLDELRKNINDDRIIRRIEDNFRLAYKEPWNKDKKELK